MYDYIKGTLVKITAKYIVIEANGLGYIVTVANPYSFSDQMNQIIQVYLHQAYFSFWNRSDDCPSHCCCR